MSDKTKELLNTIDRMNDNYTRGLSGIQDDIPLLSELLESVISDYIAEYPDHKVIFDSIEGIETQSKDAIVDGLRASGANEKAVAIFEEADEETVAQIIEIYIKALCLFKLLSNLPKHSGDDEVDRLASYMLRTELFQQEQKKKIRTATTAGDDERQRDWITPDRQLLEKTIRREVKATNKNDNGITLIISGLDDKADIDKNDIEDWSK